ncbi:MAG: hypothetical protein QOD42_3329 [Sphingomonadales bacterium]|jgi:hypothetical protein|nr:hypothetical protein [Sphingomonadales bacterium]
MFKFPLAMLLAAAALGASASASASARQPQRLDRDPATREEVRIFARFSRCVAGHWADRERSRALLALDYRTEHYRHELLRLAGDNSRCVPPGSRLAFGGVLFAGGLAENLLRQRGAVADLAGWVALDPARPAIASRDETELMALCVVRAAPAKVSALLRTAPASDEEGAALHALLPEFASCLRAGSGVTLNRLSGRAILALAAYRLADHNGWSRPRAAAAASGG